MKYQDFKMIEALMASDKKEPKKDSDVEVYVKVAKIIKKMEAKKKEEDKGKEKKDEKKKSWWDELGTFQKVIVIFAVTPFVTLLQMSPFIFLFTFLYKMVH